MSFPNSMSIQIINPLDLPNWDELISRHSNANPFHSSAWARVLVDTYGFKPLYLCTFQGERLSACPWFYNYIMSSFLAFLAGSA